MIAGFCEAMAGKKAQDSLLVVREGEAKRLSDWMECRSDAHPHGLAGLRVLLPRYLTSNTRDTSADGYSCSEWGEAAGVDPFSPTAITHTGSQS